jgi:RimJ/RimL family protein N-acetyltransferase
MMRELEANAFERVRPLLEGMEHNLILAAVIEGSSPGRIWTDDVDEPRTAMMRTPEGHYLMGRLPHAERTASLQAFIVGEMLPEAREAGWGCFGLHYPDRTWETLLAELFAEWEQVWDYQRYFVLRELRADWRDGLPAEFRMKRVTEMLLGQSGLTNVGLLRGWAEGNFGSVPEFERNGFGFCIMRGEDIASWCMAGCVSGHRAEMGIQTDERYRRRGFAKRAAAAAAEHCLANGATDIGWHCWSANLASAATATAVGFEEVLQHPGINAWFSRCDGLLVRGNQCLLRQQHAEAAECYEKAFGEMAAGRPEADRPTIVRTGADLAKYYYKAASARALAGDPEAASGHLEKALECGTDRWMLY